MITQDFLLFHHAYNLDHQYLILFFVYFSSINLLIHNKLENVFYDVQIQINIQLILQIDPKIEQNQFIFLYV
jgi:hypothetical protein